MWIMKDDKEGWSQTGYFPAKVLAKTFKNPVAYASVNEEARKETISEQVRGKSGYGLDTCYGWITVPLSGVAMTWAPEGKRKKGRPRETWRTCCCCCWWWNIKRILVRNSTNWEHNRRERLNDNGWLFLGRSRAGSSWQCLREVNQFWPYFPYGEMELELIPSSVMIRATRPVGKRTIGRGNSGSYNSGADRSNQN